MIVKVQKSYEDTNKWFMMDNITEVHYDSKIKPFPTDEEFITTEDYITFIREGCVHYNVIIVKNKIKRTEIRILFDTVAYICNDAGKTLEKILGHSGTCDNALHAGPPAVAEK